MAHKEYIMLNGCPFVFTNRTFAIFEIGGSIERSLTGKAHKDVLTTKRKWSFSFDGASLNDVIRLSRIYEAGTEVTLIDYDDSVYTVLISSSEFPENEQADEMYSVSMDFEEV